MEERNVLDVLGDQRYARLSTFRKSGEAVPTAVWFARVGDVIYVVTGRNTGKAKRIRNNPDVLLAPSDVRGRPKGEDAGATARQTDQQKGDPADRALRGKYGWQYRAFLFVEGLLGSPDELVFMEFRPRERGRGAAVTLFEGFASETVDVGGVTIPVRVAGDGPPLLLLHGNPQTHAMWHLVAPALAEDFTVVAPDLRGYGDSSKPETDAEHAPYSKRTMAQDQVSLMRHFGFDRFNLCGHDRGGRVGYRTALDHPDRVEKLAVLDIVPTWETFSRADMAFGMGYWHWFFLAQPHDLPERLLAADPENALFRAGVEAYAPEALDEYRRCLRDPETIHAICEDYRAAATIDFDHDAEDREAGRKISCPLLALWGRQGNLEEWYDVLAIWRDWADQVQGRAIDSGHYIPEEAPEETLAELRGFFRAVSGRPRA